MAQPPIDVDTVVAAWRESAETAAQLASVKTFEARRGRYGTWPGGLNPSVVGVLRAAGYVEPYRHQAEATERFLQGANVLVQTGTSSGKSLCYQAPTLQVLESEPLARVLYLFPTKALAQDQLGKLEALLPEGFGCGTYDGDTPKTRRGPIRQSAQVILTNPDMLHVGILPSHELWTRFLKSLRLIVLDEVHVYKGVFGAHVAGILRRLLRLCAWHGASPRFVAASATIANGKEVAEKLTGQPFELVDYDEAPKSRKTFVFWNPPVDEQEQRASANTVSSNLLAETATMGYKTLCFSQSRVGSELVLRYARAKLTDDAAAKLESYRGGYTAKERRSLEQALFKGKLAGLSATNALELGVDVGGLDVVLMNGYPGSVSAFWQQAGRSGRSGRDGLAVLVARDDPLDQFFMREPNLLLDGVPEPVVVYPENALVLGQQLRCAAFERPLSPLELDAFADSALELAEQLDASGDLAFRNGLFFYPSHEAPASGVSIRGAGEGNVRLMLDGQELGNMDFARALVQAHTGAVYLHRGESYLVRELDLARKTAEVERRALDYYTRAVAQSLIVPEVDLSLKPTGVASLTYGSVSVTDTVVSYRKLAMSSGATLETLPLELPPQSFNTLGLRIDLPEIDEDETAVFGVHALEHVLLSMAPWVAGCDRNDLGSAWFAQYHETLRPAVFVFDRTPGGLGLCERLFQDSERWLRESLKLVEGCPCQDGCPACILSSGCESGNEYLSKVEGIRLLRHLAT